MTAGVVMERASCEEDFDEAVGAPPTERLEPVAVAARRACATPSPARWREGRVDVVLALMDVHDDLLPPRPRRDLAALARSSVGVRADVRCWQPGAWAPFSEQDAIVRGGLEASLQGIADRRRNRIDLGPGVCAGLDRYLRRERPTELSYENFELAAGLIVLTHQAEHLRTPAAAEAEVECRAVQHVRPLVRTAWDAAYANELALQAWELSYGRLPEHLRTPACRNGGPLDRHPASRAWP